MNAIQFKVIGTGLVFLFVFFTGFWLSRHGSPYGTGLLTAHKLISLAVFIILMVTMYQVNKLDGLSGSEWALALVTAVLFITTIIAGGLISANLELPTVVRTWHHIAPYLTVASTVTTLSLLFNHAQQLIQ